MLRKIYEVLAARMRKLTTARARKNKRTARMLANARKDHSIPLVCNPDLLAYKVTLRLPIMHVTFLISIKS